MGKSKHVIIGAGPAALAAAHAIRSIKRYDEIKLISKEKCLPYSPASLPYLFSGELNEDGLFAKGDQLLNSLDVTLVRGREIVGLLPESKVVAYKNGDREGYDKLLIATGAHPWVPEWLDGQEICKFRTFDDYQLLKKKQNIAIYGAGLVAVEIAEKLALAGHNVTIIARSSLLRRYFSKKSVAFIKNGFEKKGVCIFSNSPLKAIQKSKGMLHLSLDGGQNVAADVLIVATGVTPNLIHADNLETTADGLVAGKYLNTTLPDVYVAGDAAAAPEFFTGAHGVNPILTEAMEQGKVAGNNMAGQTTEYRGWISSNFLRCLDHHLFTAGINDPQDNLQTEVLEKAEGNRFLRLTLKEGCLIGVEALNIPSLTPGVFRYLILNRVPVGSFKESLINNPVETANWLMLNNRKEKTFKLFTRK